MPENTSTRLPSYAQIENILVARISSGALPVGTQLPSDEDLIRELDVSQTTIGTTTQNFAHQARRRSGCRRNVRCDCVIALAILFPGFAVWLGHREITAGGNNRSVPVSNRAAPTVLTAVFRRTGMPHSLCRVAVLAGVLLPVRRRSPRNLCMFTAPVDRSGDERGSGRPNTRTVFMGRSSWVQLLNGWDRRKLTPAASSADRKSRYPTSSRRFTSYCVARNEQVFHEDPK
jgi:hypothetical protein